MLRISAVHEKLSSRKKESFVNFCKTKYIGKEVSNVVASRKPKLLRADVKAGGRWVRPVLQVELCISSGATAGVKQVGLGRSLKD